MAARLGNVLYWVGCIAAAFVLALFGLMWATGFLGGDPETPIFYGVIAAIIAAICWGVGRACRYVLAGT
jgi:hypothetical protein